MIWRLPLSAPSSEHVALHETLRNIYRTTLAAYIRSFIGPCPPQPVDWARGTLSCECKHCQQYNTFLRDPGVIQYWSGAGTRTRDHFEVQVRAEAMCSWETLPNEGVLVITKPLGEGNHNVEHWGRRREVAADSMRSIGVENPRRLIGPGISDPLIICPWVLETLGLQAPAVRTPLSEARVNPMVRQAPYQPARGSKPAKDGEKRPETIDLTR